MEGRAGRRIFLSCLLLLTALRPSQPTQELLQVPGLPNESPPLRGIVPLINCYSRVTQVVCSALQISYCNFKQAGKAILP